VRWTNISLTVSEEFFVHFFSGPQTNNFNFNGFAGIGY